MSRTSESDRIAGRAKGAPMGQGRGPATGELVRDRYSVHLRITMSWVYLRELDKSVLTIHPQETFICVIGCAISSTLLSESRKQVRQAGLCMFNI